MIFSDYLNPKHNSVKEEYVLKSKSIVISSSGNGGGSYMFESLYESYIQSKIDAEDRLAFALKESMIISESDYSNIRAIQEAKLSDKIKSKWLKFVAFIKRLFAKFLESMNNILLDEKDYLDKYKDIILKKTPKEELKFSYTGDYPTGINRLINTSVPLFNYATYKKELEAEDDNDSMLIKRIMPSDFTYTDAETLAEQCKGYFLAYEKGQKEGKISTLKMVDLYNFCYNLSKIKKVVDTDINRIESSTRAIETEINKQINATPKEESAILYETGGATNGASGGTTNGTGAGTTNGDGENQEDANTPKGVKITTVAANTMNSTSDRNKDEEQTNANTSAEKAKEDNIDNTKITNAADKWIRVCRSIVSAKLTAYQQISKDYMEIIRAHVRSYGGVDKKDKEGNKAPETATEYSKEKAQKELDDANKKVNKAKNKPIDQAVD